MITRLEMFYPGKRGINNYRDVEEAVHSWLVEHIDSGKFKIIKIMQSEGPSGRIGPSITISILYQSVELEE